MEAKIRVDDTEGLVLLMEGLEIVDDSGVGIVKQLDGDLLVGWVVEAEFGWVNGGWRQVGEWDARGWRWGRHGSRWVVGGL